MKRRNLLLLTAAGMAVAMVFGWFMARWLPPSDPGSRRATAGTTRRALPQVVRTSRYLPARLTGGFAHASFPTVNRPESPGQEEELRRFVNDADLAVFRGAGIDRQQRDGAIESLRRYRETTGPEAEHHLGEAIRALEIARERDPEAAEVWSDLSACLFERSQLYAEPLDTLAALDAVNRALGRNPRLAEALFNRALVLGSLGLLTPALAAWDEFLGVETDSGWRAEAAALRSELARPRPSRPEITRRIAEEAAAGKEQALLADVGRFRFEARVLIEEEWLPRWGEAVLEGREDEAERLLTAAEAVAGILTETTSDPLYAEAVAGLREAAAQRSPRLALLAAGAQDFGTGVVAIQSERAAEAAAALGRARQAFEAAGNPFAWRCALKLAIAEDRLAYSGEGAQEHARRAWELLAETLAAADPYPTLRGDSWWMRGLIHTRRQRPAEAAEAYGEAREAYRMTGELDRLAGIDNLLAERRGIVGELREAWRLLGEALAAAPELTDPGRRGQIHANAATWALAAGYPEIALVFEDEALADAEASGNPWAQAEAWRRRAVIRRRMGDLDGARQGLRQARKIVATMAEAEQPLPGARLGMEEGVLELETDPRAAVQRAEESLAVYRDTAYLATFSEALLVASRAYAAAGDPSRAEAALAEAIATAEDTRRGLGTEAERIAFLHQAEEAVDALVAHELASGRIEEAFLTSERKRGRALRDRWEESPRDDRQEPRQEVLALGARLGPERALVTYTLAGGELSAWVLRPGRLDWVPLGVRGAEITPRVRRLREALGETGRAWRDVADSFRLEAQALYQDLIAPLRPYLDGVEILVIVPEGPLFALPFAALMDGDRYLIEDFALAASPSARLYGDLLEAGRLRGTETVSAGAGAPGGGRGRGAAAVFGNPDFDREAWPFLGSLSGAEDEAKGVAALLGVQPVLGSAATKEGFLAALAAGPRVVGFAGHALDNPLYPDASRLFFTPAGPDAGPGRGPDAGTLRAGELAGRTFPGTLLVVLSGCSTAGEHAASAEGVRNLARPFLAGGVPAVVATLDRIRDEAASPLVIELFRRLQQEGGDVSRALQQAQLSLLRGPKEAFRRPAAWAFFQLQGEATFTPPPTHPGADLVPRS